MAVIERRQAAAIGAGRRQQAGRAAVLHHRQIAALHDQGRQGVGREVAGEHAVVDQGRVVMLITADHLGQQQAAAGLIPRLGDHRHPAQTRIADARHVDHRIGRVQPGGDDAGELALADDGQTEQLALVGKVDRPIDAVGARVQIDGVGGARPGIGAVHIARIEIDGIGADVVAAGLQGGRVGLIGSVRTEHVGRRAVLAQLPPGAVGGANLAGMVRLVLGAAISRPAAVTRRAATGQPDRHGRRREAGRGQGGAIRQHRQIGEGRLGPGRVGQQRRRGEQTGREQSSTRDHRRLHTTRAALPAD